MDYDVFLSHNSKDKSVVEQIGLKLKEKYGLKCWLDKWNLVPGEPWQEALEEALDQCQTIAVFVGPNMISPWENEEMRSALETRVRDRSRRVIPVLLPGAPDNQELKLPKFLTRLTWVDMRTGTNDANSLYLLYCGIKGIAPEEGIKSEDKSGTLPIGSHIPFPRNALFTGRVKELERLADSLLGKKPSVTLISQAIIGMGGIGKTQLVVEFAYRYGYRFKGAHWLDLRDPSGLDGEIAKSGSIMNIQPWSEKQPEQVQQTLQAWQADGPRLLILDNFEDVSKSNEVFKYFQHPSLRVLVTSRRKDFPKSSGLQIQEINLFTEQESFDFLQKTLDKSETQEEKKRLAEKLGNLPLALELAVSYININNISTSDYIGQLDNLITHESMQNDWFTELDITSPTKHDLSLLGTFQLSWQEVKDELQKKIFIISGYCAPNTPIPLEIFKESPEQDDKELSKALYRLNSLGLLRTIDEKPTIHPLLADYARYLDKEKTILSALTQSLVDIVNKRSIDVDRSGNYSIFTPLLPHIQLVAENADMANIQGAGYLWNDLGYHVSALANYIDAKTFYERALLIDEATFGPDHPDVARDVSNLGTALQDLGDYAGAKTMFERALLIDEATFGPDHPNVATDVNNLGSALKNLGDFKGAKVMFERALLIDEATFGPDHPDVAKVFSNLGNVLQALGDYAGAKVMIERALLIDEATFGPDHPDVARDVNNLGGALKELGDLKGAKTALERALPIYVKSKGKMHSETAEILNNLGIVSADLGNYPLAINYLRQASIVMQQALPRNHPMRKQTETNLQALLRLSKKPFMLQQRKHKRL